jgi:hypothetical protein
MTGERVMNSLSHTQSRIIRSIVIENFGANSPLLKQIAKLRFDHRHLTGKGFFIQFAPLPAALRVDDMNNAASTDIRTSLAAPRDLVGFTLFIDDGVMTSFEGYMFGSLNWPDAPMETWLILAPNAVAKQKAK